MSTKLLTIFGMLLVGLLPGLIPVLVPLLCQTRPTETTRHGKLQREMRLSTRSKKLVSALACFGAGVFIATFFLDMLKEVRVAWNDWFEAAGWTPAYPWPELFSIIGFLLVMLVEQITMFYHSRRNARDRQRFLQKSVGFRNVENGESTTVILSNSTSLPPSPVPLAPVHVERTPQKSSALTEKLQRRDSTYSSTNGSMYPDADKFRVEPHDVSTTDIHIEPSQLEKTNFKSVMRSLILLLALCFHSLFEGMAIGLMKNHKETLTLFFSVCMHKGIVAFCLGLNISQSGLRPFLVALFIVVFASMSPLGIALGLAVSHAPATLTRYAVIAVLQGISSGTFLYVTFIEILPKELLKNEMTDHEHSNIFLEDMQHTSKETAATTTFGCDESCTSDHRNPRQRHLDGHVAAAAEFDQQADKLIKCMAFSAGVALMAFAVALTGGH